MTKNHPYQDRSHQRVTPCLQSIQTNDDEMSVTSEMCPQDEIVSLTSLLMRAAVVDASKTDDPVVAKMIARLSAAQCLVAKRMKQAVVESTQQVIQTRLHHQALPMLSNQEQVHFQRSAFQLRALMRI